MRALAILLGADEPEFWEIVGILHDVDLPKTEMDLSRHGLLAVEMLADILPAEGLQAIAAHDHRSGVSPQSSLDESLRAADSLEPWARRVPLANWEAIASGANSDAEAYLALRELRAPSGSHQVDAVESFAAARALSFEDVVDIVRIVQGNPDP